MGNMVVTAKHHDGFAMHHSKVSPYNIVDGTPCQRDLLQELSEACARAGIQPACLINGRVGHYEQELMGDYQNMDDNGMLTGGIEEDWETPPTLKWSNPADQASWRVRFIEPGRYRVRLECAGAPGRPTGTFVLSTGDQNVHLESPQASDLQHVASLAP